MSRLNLEINQPNDAPISAEMRHTEERKGSHGAGGGVAAKYACNVDAIIIYIFIYIARQTFDICDNTMWQGVIFLSRRLSLMILPLFLVFSLKRVTPAEKIADAKEMKLSTLSRHNEHQVCSDVLAISSSLRSLSLCLSSWRQVAKGQGV